MLLVLSLLLQLVSVVCWVLVLVHAFQRSLGTGFMVLCIPVYNIVYAFSQFEHRFKGLILTGAFGGFVLAVALRPLALALATHPPT